MPCRTNCGLCCSAIHLPASKRELLEFADRQPTAVAFRRWARRLMPITADVDGVHRTYACLDLDRETKKCKNYDERPWICAAYPFYRHGPDVMRDFEQLPPSCGYLTESLTSVAIGG